MLDDAGRRCCATRRGLAGRVGRRPAGDAGRSARRRSPAGRDRAPATPVEPGPPRVRDLHLRLDRAAQGRAGRRTAGIVDRLLRTQRRYGSGADDRVLQSTPMSFDASTLGVCLCRCSPAPRWSCARPGRTPDTGRPGRASSGRQRITTVHFVPSMPVRLRSPSAAAAACPSLRRVICRRRGAAARARRTGSPTARPPSCCNGYGPTETTVVVTAMARAPDGAGRSESRSAGRSGQHRGLRARRAAATGAGGVPGELYIGGAGLARGYLDRPELTAERFVADPFGARRAGCTAPATWSGGCRTGVLEFLGRADDQVKVRGFRIEPARSRRCCRGIRRCAQAAVRGPRGPAGRQAAGRLRRRRGRRPLDADGAARARRLRLPEYMVPAAFVALDALPLTPNGKLDRRPLPAPRTAPARPRPAAARRRARRPLCGLFAEVLGRRPRSGIDDDFFDLGGHSLLATRLVAGSARRSASSCRVAGRCSRRRPWPGWPAVRRRAGAPRGPPLRAGGPARAACRCRSPSSGCGSCDQLGGAERPPTTSRWRCGCPARWTRPRCARRWATWSARHEALRTVLPGVADGAPYQQVAAGDGRGPPCRRSAGPATAAAGRCRRGAAAVRPGARTCRCGPRCSRCGDRPARAAAGHAPHRRRRLVARPAAARPGHRLRGPAAGGAPRLGAAAGAVRRLRPLAARRCSATADARAGRQLGLLAADAGRAAGGAARCPPTGRARRSPHRGGGRVAVDVDADAAPAAGAAWPAAAAPPCSWCCRPALAALLSRLGAGDDIPLGTPVAGRTDEALDDLVGFFVNTLVLRTDTVRRPELRRAARPGPGDRPGRLRAPGRAVRRLVEALNPARSLAAHPLFQVMLVLQTSRQAPSDFPGWTCPLSNRRTGHGEVRPVASLVDAGDELTVRPTTPATCSTAATASDLAGDCSGCSTRRDRPGRAARRSCDRSPDRAGRALAPATVPTPAAATARPGRAVPAQVAATPDAVALVVGGDQR